LEANVGQKEDTIITEHTYILAHNTSLGNTANMFSYGLKHHTTQEKVTATRG
jgi:hypothetical protein